MAVDSVSSLTPIVFTFSTPAEVNSVGEVLITPANLAAPASEIANDSEVAGDTVGDALDTLDTAVQAAQIDADAALSRSAIEWLAVSFRVDPGQGGAVFVAAPVTGTLTTMRVGVGANPEGDINVSTSINGVGVTGGTFDVLNGTTPGTQQTVTPSANNSVTALTSSVGLEWDNGSSATVWLVALLGFTRS